MFILLEIVYIIYDIPSYNINHYIHTSSSMGGGWLGDSAFMVMDRWVMVRHLCLKFNTITSPLNPPPKGGKGFAGAPVLGLDDWERAGKPVKTGEVGAILYGGCIYFTSILYAQYIVWLYPQYTVWCGCILSILYGCILSILYGCNLTSILYTQYGLCIYLTSGRISSKYLE